MGEAILFKGKWAKPTISNFLDCLACKPASIKSAAQKDQPFLRPAPKNARSGVCRPSRPGPEFAWAFHFPGRMLLAFLLNFGHLPSPLAILF